MLDAVVDLPAQPGDIPPPRARHEGDRGARAPGRRRRAVLGALAFKIMTDPTSASSPTPGSTRASWPTGAVLNSTKDRKERAGRILQMHANHREDREGRLRRRHRRRSSGIEADDHGRHPLRPERARSCSSPSSSPTGHPCRGRAQDQKRPGQTRPGPCNRCPRRTRPSRSTATRRPARPSSAAWASCTSRSSWTGCCGSSGSTPTWASPRWPTARPSASPREGRGALRPPDRRSGPVRPRRHRPRAHRPGGRLRVRRQDHRRRDS